MYVIDSAIANRIVDRTMKIIGHNINVMNAQGVILGSGSNERIGSIHEGALLAISQNRNVEINQDIAPSLHGVKSGLNLPLHYQGQIVGVIGITGQPCELAQYGELLKMTAEMIVEQANLQDQLQWQNRQKEEFILQLIRDEDKDVDQLTHWGHQLGIDITVERVVAIIEIESVKQQQVHNNQALKQIVHLLQHPDRNNLIAMTSLNQLVILKPAYLNGKQWDPELESHRIDKLLKRIPANMELNLNISLGHFFIGIEGIAKSYRTAKETLAIGKSLNPESSKYLYEDYALQVIFTGLKQHWRGDALSAPYLKLVEADKNGVLQKTLSVYIQHIGDHKQCAEVLFIHRNTLRYRLDKIQQITGTNLQEFHHLLNLYLGQIMHQA
ncbi:sugar diacid recognition domain-containing protein [Shewanella sp. 1_MG-2023]|uniref:Helix-turn-helix domain-containing protein n=1 Tax=Shewanella electrodiphila TaxID=934143 RepID=A0ABT0KQR8_9GAMM|nr:MULTISPECIES: sugar diacid recognition domain-containing protein [Shewanella]MCL1046186.1 helix-turn-helix domain-containing protein [Shewanella electrodiphila]MDO6612257.1 sugar diacid recognition domain-containing protein [Shewanella sp. 7_MG-2023]MDO6772111.1 sugar diacid recognition domain-containing protein [Shewanella sp. 2_MG-2023]MDO6796076.1 sugar diacid recognition domain-containing protein [Shewanella sp. 1_MG-2023]